MGGAALGLLPSEHSEPPRFIYRGTATKQPSYFELKVLFKGKMNPAGPAALGSDP